MAVLLGAVAFAIATGVAGAQPVALGPPSVVDGPSGAIESLGGLSVARDGTGGLAYVKDVLGIPHVFVSRLTGGVFGAPQQIDSSLPLGSSQPVIAACNGGVLLVAFVNGGRLFVVDAGSSAGGFTGPAMLSAGASDPAIAVSNYGKGYLAFTAAGSGGHDVRVAYYNRGAWSLVGAPLDANPADDAGTGAGRPAVGAAGDGVGIVAWGEAGHVYSRKVWATAPSIVFEQADVPTFSGWNEVSADQPAVGVGGDSSYADIAYRETLSSGSAHQTRVLLARLHGSQFDALAPGDGLTTPGIDGADQPAVALDEYGQGLATAERTGSNALFSMQVQGSAAPGPVARLDSLTNSGAPHAAPASAGYHDGLVAWEQQPGSAGPAEIRARFFDGSSFGQELVASSPLAGAVNGAAGLDAAGDIAADVAIAWVQGSGASTEIVTGQLYQPPGGFRSKSGFHYVRTARPTLSWTTPRDLWPPLRYVVSVDGAQIGQTGATQLSPQLSDGNHSFTVTAFNRGGLTSTMRASRLWVDTVAPAATLKLTGKLRVGSTIRLSASYTDAPPPEPRAAASGIAKVKVSWGDGTVATIRHRMSHVYTRAGRYTIKLTVTDRAGNKTIVKRVIRIRAKPKPKHPSKRAHK